MRAVLMQDSQLQVAPSSMSPPTTRGSKLPWKVLMHYEKDSRMLLRDSVDDGVLRFEATRIEVAA